MRKALTIFFALLTGIIAGCETDRTIFSGPYFIRFTESTLTELESYSKPIDIEIQQAGPALDEDLTITYQVSGSARENVDFVILSDEGKVIIKKGDYLAYIRVQLINNSNNILRSQSVVFTIVGASNGERRIGQGESMIGRTFTFTIKDDCILGGTYIGHNGSPAISGITITSTDCETYTLSNWNINIFDIGTVMDLKFKDEGDNTLTIPLQEEANLPSDVASIKGTGVVDPTTRNIIMTVTLLDFDDQPEVSFTLTPD